MKKLFTSLAAIIIVAMTIIMLMGCDKENKQSRTRVQIPTTVSTTDVTTETSVTTSTTSITTTIDTTNSTSTTTTSTTTVATTEYTEEETVLVEEEYQTYTETVTIPVTEEETQSNMTINNSINELTYYSGPIGCYGRWGRTLINDYSIASNLLSDGTIVHIESEDGSICGDYRVDDTGGMGNNVIDIFYTDYSNVPYSFSRDGRIPCTVWVYE